MKIKTLQIALLIALISIVLLLLLASNVIPLPNIWAQFTRDLAISLFVAAVILMTVEVFTKSELLGDIRNFLSKGAEDIRNAEFAKTLSDRITPDIFNQVDQFIIKSPYLLKDMKVNLEFLESDSNTLKLVDTTSFKVTNLTTATIKDDLPAYENSELTSEYPEYPIVTNIEIEGQKRLDELRATGKIIRQGSRLKIDFPISLPSGETIEIQFTIVKYVRNSDSDIWNVTHKTSNLSISCAGPENLEVRAYPIHPDVNFFKSIVGSEQARLKRWDIECGILPFQGIQLWWKQSNPQSRADS